MEVSLENKLLRLGLRKIGNFTLSSGLESTHFWDIERLFDYPEWVRFEAIREFTWKIGIMRPDLLIGIRSGGLLLAKDIGKCLSIPVLDDSYSCIESLTTYNCLSTIVVDDVITTGGTIKKKGVLERNSKAIAVAVLVNRSSLDTLRGLPIISGIYTDRV